MEVELSEMVSEGRKMAPWLNENKTRSMRFSKIQSEEINKIKYLGILMGTSWSTGVLKKILIMNMVYYA